MAFAFNDDKSKVEVYSKSDIVVLRKTTTNYTGGFLQFEFTEEELQAAGIDPLDIMGVHGWSIISVTQINWNQYSEETMETAISIYDSHVFPSAVFIKDTNEWRLVGNVYSTAQYIAGVGVEIVLMKR